MIVSLTGFMGSGKSSVGEILAARLGCEWVDLDSYIEKKIGLSIPEIFEFQGETGFRAIEAEAIRDVLVMHILTHTDMVLSLGGGSLQIGALRDYILENTRCFYLQAPLETLLGRIGADRSSRPVLAGCQAPEELLAEREKNYRLAHRTVPTGGLTAEQVAGQIYGIIKGGKVDD